MNLTEHLLSKNTILLQAEAANWQEAVRLGTDLLEKAGTVKPEYFRAIVDNVETLGPYFLLAPGIAMPHARPEGGVLENSFALVTLKTPVNFGDPDNDPVDILVTLAAKDAETQNESSIVQVVELLDDEVRLQKMRHAKTIAELQVLFEELNGKDSA